MAPTARPQRIDDPASQPDDEAAHSGRLLLRMPQSLHSELARTAEREGVSLNSLITGILSGAVQWRAGEGGGGGESRGRFMRIVLIADLALVAIAAVTAIALLIAAST